MAAQGRELARHFQSEGTPVMIGTGFRAFGLPWLGGEYVKFTMHVNI